jgi:calcineurin-like phosphoesterase family protein
MRRKAIALYGHSHGRLPGNSMSLDVGVDCRGFAPVRLDDIRRRMRTLPEAPDPEGDPGDS